MARQCQRSATTNAHKIPPLATIHRLPLRQCWGLTAEKILQRMKALLARNILVLSVSRRSLWSLSDSCAYDPEDTWPHLYRREVDVLGNVVQILHVVRIWDRGVDVLRDIVSHHVTEGRRRDRRDAVAHRMGPGCREAAQMAWQRKVSAVRQILRSASSARRLCPHAGTRIVPSTAARCEWSGRTACLTSGEQQNAELRCERSAHDKRASQHSAHCSGGGST